MRPSGRNAAAATMALTIGAILLAPMTLAAVGSGSAFALSSAGSGGATLLLGTGWTLALAAIGVRRRPNRQTVAALLATAAIAWYATDWLDPSTSSLVFSAGLALHATAPAVAGHLAVSYPSGRLTGVAARCLVGAGYVIAAVGLGLGPALFFDPRSEGCFGCARSAWVVAESPAASDLVNRVGEAARVLWAVAMVAWLVWRFVVGAPARRRATVLVSVAAGASLGAVVVDSLAGLRGGYLDRGLAEVALWRLQGVTLAAVGLAVAVDLVRVRLVQRALARLVVELGDPSPVTLRSGLAARLHEPDLVVAYPADGEGRYVDAAGVDVAVDAGGRSRTTLRIGGAELALLLHRPGLLETPDLAADLGAAIRLGLENERLQAQALVQLAALRASGVRLVTAGDAERRRLERDLHDGAQQRLIGVLLGLRLARAGGAPDRPDLDRVDELLRQAIAELRELAHGIHPVLLADAGLAAAVNALSEWTDLRVDGIVPGRWPDVIEATAYSLIATAAAAGPTRVVVRRERADLVVEISLTGMLPDLHAVRDRVQTLSGTLTVEDSPAAVVMTVPIG